EIAHENVLGHHRKGAGIHARFKPGVSVRLPSDCRTAVVQKKSAAKARRRARFPIESIAYSSS
ncbi:MAG: hypothetical protein ACRCTX_27820, partial [Afipia sp.]